MLTGVKCFFVLMLVAAYPFLSLAGEHSLTGQDSCEISSEFGHFNLKRPTVLLELGRNITLESELVFYDADGKEWIAEKGFESDGASIPRLFWGQIGGPLDGSYRLAAIIHDSYCVKKNRPWRDVHRTFYRALRASGVSEAKAKIMYAAVRYFGPRWDDNGNSIAPRARSEHSAKLVIKWIKKVNPSIREIENLRLISDIDI